MNRMIGLLFTIMIGLVVGSILNRYMNNQSDTRIYIIDVCDVDDTSLIHKQKLLRTYKL